MNLAEALKNAYSRQELLEVGEQKGLQMGHGQQKAELAEQLARHMLQPQVIARYLLWSPIEDLNRLHRIINWGQAAPIDLRHGDFVPKTLRRGNYFFERAMEDGALHGEIPSDVISSMLYAWTKEFVAYYKQIDWLQVCLHVGLSLYRLIPARVLEQLLRRNPKCSLAVGEAMDAIAQMPEDIRWAATDGAYAYSRWLPQETKQQMMEEAAGEYYIPTREELANDDVIGRKARRVLRQMVQAMQGKWRNMDHRSVINLSVSMYFLMMVDAPDEEMREKIEEYDLGIVSPEAVWRYIRPILRKMSPYVRRVQNHGFTDSEMRQGQGQGASTVISFAQERERKRGK